VPDAGEGGRSGGWERRQVNVTGEKIRTAEDLKIADVGSMDEKVTVRNTLGWGGIGCGVW